MKFAWIFSSYLLLLSAPAAAAEIYYGYDFNGRKMGIELIPKDECLNTLSAVFYPEKSISEGLDALQSLSSGQVGDVSSCLNDIVGTWNSKIPPAANSLAPSSYSSSNNSNLPPELDDMRKKYEDLYRRARCYNPYSPGSSNFKYHEMDYKAQCANKWISKAEGDALQAQGKKAEQEFQVAYQKYSSELSSMQLLAGALVGPDPSKWMQARYNELDKVKNCYNSFAPSEFNYNEKQKWISSNCGGKASTKEEKEAAEKEQAQISQDYNKAQLKYSQDLAKVSKFLASPSAAGAFDKASAMDKVNKLKCANPYPAGTFTAKDYENSYQSACSGKWLGMAEAAALRESLRADFKDIDKLIEKAEEEARKIEAERQRLIDLSDGERRSQYGMRRLLARFRGYLNTGGNPSELAEFCQDYEKLQRRDKLYSEKIGEKGIKLQAFVDEAHWKWAQKYGFTEGELSAMSAYIGSFYGTINPALWKKGELPESLRVYKEAMDAAMERMPTYTDTQVRRFAKLPSNVVDQHQVGSIVQYDAYTSTSNRSDWNWGGQHRFLIYSGRNGKDLRELNGGESEILFKAGTRFKVISREEKMGNVEFVMAEVDEAGNVIADLNAPLPSNKTPPKP